MKIEKIALTRINTELHDLERQFDKHIITGKEYVEKHNKLIKQRDNIIRKVIENGQARM
jgi:hypothetical protein